MPLNVTYAQLAKIIEKMTPEQKESNVTVRTYDDEYVPAIIEFTDEEEDDTLDHNHPVISLFYEDEELNSRPTESQINALIESMISKQLGIKVDDVFCLPKTIHDYAKKHNVTLEPTGELSDTTGENLVRDEITWSILGVSLDESELNCWERVEVIWSGNGREPILPKETRMLFLNRYRKIPAIHILR